MSFKGVLQPEIIMIDNGLRLVKATSSMFEKAIPWYQNPVIMYYSEGVTDQVYDFDTIKKMYTYLSHEGELYFIELYEDDKWLTIGDTALLEKNLPIVIGNEKYWGRGIGKKVVSCLLGRARDIGIKSISLIIDTYNERSQRLFKSMGFKEVSVSGIDISFVIHLG